MACFDFLLLGIGLLTVAGGCGARSALEDGPGSGPAGGAGAGANGSGADGAGAGLSQYDPDEECPNVGCSGDDCAPAVLTRGRAIGWATIDGGDLYFTTNDAEAENALIRVPICGGEEQVLLERTRFAGEGTIAGDYLYIPVEEPAKEVLRLPKAGGAATVVHTHEAGDPYITRAVTAANGYVMLSQYSFDGGLVLKEINPKGKAYAVNENLPDQDWFLVTSVASGFLPNKPAFIDSDPDNFYVINALIGSDLGIHQVRVSANIYNDYVWMQPFNLELPVVGPILVTDSTEAGLTVFFSSDEEFVWPVHYKLTGGILEPILTEAGGIMLAIDGDQLFGSSNDFYMEGFEDDEFGGDIWQAAEGDEWGEGVFSTRFQNALALEIHGESVYVRTTRAVVRFPKDCQNGDDRCHFYYEE